MFFPFLVLIGGLVENYKHNFKFVKFDRKLGKMLLGVTLLIILVTQSKYLHLVQYSDKHINFQNSLGIIKVEPSPGGILLKLIKDVEGQKKDNDTLVAFPMEASINFLTKTRNPLKYDQFINGLFPPEKQKEIIMQLENEKPSFITVSNYEFIGYFGLDYNKEIYEWILDNYKETKMYGCIAPYESTKDCRGYGIRLFRANN